MTEKLRRQNVNDILMTQRWPKFKELTDKLTLDTKTK